MRIMGLDLGDKTIGVAVSDPLGWTAQGVTTLRRGDLDGDLQQLAALVQQYEVEEFVLGLPKNMDGSLGPRAEMVQQFAALLRERLGRPVHLWDERLSTVAAQKHLLGADVSRRGRKKVVDKLAAVYILQGFLDRQARS
ncbi:MAG: Holliday junction resolvase RuvX [Desulfurispora sp.]|uniref:Holliday junction resolvase RuvX n=1 Tax=Desulfurispora sp. TaxID=3014275 RepID=UPI0040496512